MTTPSTDRFYEEYSKDYFNRTVFADISHLYPEFLKLLPDRGRILDAGAGSGRDLLAFSKLGYDVLGLDSSASLATLAQEYSGEEVIVNSFENIEYRECFDGIWACASLLHSNEQLLKQILKKFHNALVVEGVLFASVREGTGTIKADDGRIYNCYTAREFTKIVEDSGFEVKSIWNTKDAIEGRDELSWINLIGIKKSTSP